MHHSGACSDCWDVDCYKVMQSIYNANPEKVVVGMVGRTLPLNSARQREVLHQQEDLPLPQLAGLQHTGLQRRQLSPQVHGR